MVGEGQAGVLGLAVIPLEAGYLHKAAFSPKHPTKGSREAL